MLRRSACRLDGSNIIGGPVQNLQGSMRSVIKPCIAEHVLRETAAVRQRIAVALAAADADGGEKPAYAPPLPRAWVKAPLSRLSTSASRRDWFRLMQFNTMTDAWSGDRQQVTTPVHGVQVRVPGFTREGVDPAAFCPYDATIDAEVPPFVRPDFRRVYLVNTLRYYDPDVVCLQEVNRCFFNDVMWKYVRYCGYGALYQSSRGYNVRALRRGDDPHAPRHRGKIEESEDIGNVVLFHKGRFVPILMPGKDLVQHLHFAHIVSMRDKVTNMTLNVACVQFTAGESNEAAQIRLQEAQQTLKVIDALNRNDADRAHMSNVICGDFNNVDDEEGCVQLMRERLFSTYDVVGGPRWTAWFHEDPQAGAGYAKYYACNRECYERTNPTRRAEREVAKYTRKDNKGNRSSEMTSGGAATAKESPSAAEVGGEECRSATVAEELQSPKEGEAGNERGAKEEDGVREDALAMRKSSMRASGIICRTQDFVFYDPQTLALHQVLDVPEEAQISEQQLLPCSGHPSHHIHLVVDVSFTDVSPDTGARSLKD